MQRKHVGARTVARRSAGSGLWPDAQNTKIKTGLLFHICSFRSLRRKISNCVPLVLASTRVPVRSSKPSMCKTANNRYSPATLITKRLSTDTKLLLPRANVQNQSRALRRHTPTQAQMSRRFFPHSGSASVAASAAPASSVRIAGALYAAKWRSRHGYTLSLRHKNIEPSGLEQQHHAGVSWACRRPWRSLVG